jgi:hypothetical protein
MDYPFKSVALDSTPGGNVVASCVNYAPGGDLVPPPGGSIQHLNADSPVDIGWSRVYDEDSRQWIWQPPIKVSNVKQAA